MEAGERLYRELGAEGIDVIIDDRDERPGVKFYDAELVGFPYRVTVGPRGLERGTVELVERRTGESRELKPQEAAGIVAEQVRAART